MPLHIDRVQTQMEVLPSGSGGAGAAPVGGLVPGTPDYDPALEARLREVVMEVLYEHLRELERRGTL